MTDDAPLFGGMDELEKETSGGTPTALGADLPATGGSVAGDADPDAVDAAAGNASGRGLEERQGEPPDVDLPEEEQEGYGADDATGGFRYPPNRILGPSA